MSEEFKPVPPKKSPEEIEKDHEPVLPETESILKPEASAGESKAEQPLSARQEIHREVERRKALREEAQAEKGQLNAVRTRLGLEEKNPDSQTTPATEETSETRRSQKESEESQERERGLREGSKQVEEAIVSFASVIQERAKNDMDPFMDSRTFSSIRAGAGALTNFSEGRGAVNTEELAGALNSISRGLGQMERQSRGGPVRESDESLRRIGYTTQLLSEAAKNLSKNFKEGDEQAAGAARRLYESAEQAGIFMGRLRSALRNYNGR